jgi:hypothetical protein
MRTVGARPDRRSETFWNFLKRPGEQELLDMTAVQCSRVAQNQKFPMETTHSKSQAPNDSLPHGRAQTRLLTSFVSVCVFAGLQMVAAIPASAQHRTSTLTSSWSNAGSTAFMRFTWRRIDGNTALYSSDLATELTGNTLRLFNTYKRDPFGKYARCGGLGCDLGRGQLLSTISFEPRGGLFIVRNASGTASFLTGAQCTLRGTRDMQELVCRTSQTPTSVAMPSAFIFSPGT